jgi:hypothetical protein
MRRADVSAKAVSKGKAIWAGEVFCLSGTFKASHEDIRRWVNYHGGRVVDKVTDDTTYLICSMEDFEKKVTAGKFGHGIFRRNAYQMSSQRGEKAGKAVRDNLLCLHRGLSINSQEAEKAFRGAISSE